jgi:hypothetical protein
MIEFNEKKNRIDDIMIEFNEKKNRIDDISKFYIKQKCGLKSYNLKINTK